jgi:pimeloyl-ACP methyl ester carboxylesterase
VESRFPHVPGVEHRFVEAGRLRMHVAETGAGEPLLMLHGWPQHWYVWRHVIPRLAPHARLICPDLRGFGWSDVPRGGYDRENMARDVLRLMDALGLERVRLAGHDWGGWIGFILCLRHPERFERFLAAGIAPPWPSGDPPRLADLGRLVYQLPLSTPGLGSRAGRRLAALGLRGAGLSADEVAAFVSRLGGERGRATELLYRTFLLRELGRVAAGRYSAQSLRVPTVLLLGDRDPVIPVASVERQVALSEAVELEPVSDAGHFVADERPGLVAGRALGFLLGGSSA